MNLSEAILSGVNLSGANLSRANLTGVNLSGAVVEHQQLLKTVGDPTFMADGQSPKKNWRTKKPTTRKPRKKKTPANLPQPASETTQSPPGE